MFERLEKILPRVQKPAKYIGGEPGSIIKDKSKVSLRFAFCFPDTYEVGMSHLGMKILYGVLNNEPDIWCERVFAPWVDMEAEMRREGIPLYALESLDPVAEFDVIGFTLLYELSFTNILNMLDLAGLPVRSADRRTNSAGSGLISFSFTTSQGIPRAESSSAASSSRPHDSQDFA